MYEKPFHTEDLGRYTFLVTGGGGFIGSHLVEYLLKHGAGAVRVLDNFSTGLKSNADLFRSDKRFRLIEDDICDAATCANACMDADYVLHQAALGSVPRSVKDPAATNRVNVTGFLNMLVAARDAGVKRFVYASSSSVYGDSRVLPKKEEHTGRPLSPYAVSKAANELYASVFARTYGMEIIGLRYFNIFGPRQDPHGPYAAAIPLFIRAALADDDVHIDGDGLQTRDFTFVENAVQANIRALFCENKDALGKVYNVAVGENISILAMYRMLCGICGKAPKAVHRDPRPGDIRESLADISLAADLLGYSPGVRLEEGLRLTAEWFGAGK